MLHFLNTKLAALVGLAVGKAHIAVARQETTMDCQTASGRRPQTDSLEILDSPVSMNGSFLARKTFLARKMEFGVTRRMESHGSSLRVMTVPFCG